MAKMTSEERTRLRALVQEATPGPWEAWVGNGAVMRGPSKANTPTVYTGGGSICEVDSDPWTDGDTNDDEDPDDVESAQHEADAAFIAATRNAVPALLDAIDDAERRIGEAFMLLEDANAGSGLGSGPAFRDALRRALRDGAP